jgi:hypothetical protein
LFDQDRSMTDQNPAAAVVTSVDQCLDLALTWHAWDGRPIARIIDDLPSTWAPHKAIRRITDHLIDHLHEVEALLAGAEPVPDEWHGRLVTLDSDWARFAELDFDEARSRLRRLARCYLLRYEVAGPEAWDAPRGEAWTLRQIAEHVSGVTFYAEQVGRLL